jgi:hypothetical protein
MMEMMTLKTHQCSTMDEAVAWFAAALDAGTPPDIVFMDMQLADPRRVRARHIAAAKLREKTAELTHVVFGIIRVRVMFTARCVVQRACIITARFCRAAWRRLRGSAARRRGAWEAARCPRRLSSDSPAPYIRTTSRYASQVQCQSSETLSEHPAWLTASPLARARAAGMQCVLGKPYTMEQIRSAVVKYCGAWRA